MTSSSAATTRHSTGIPALDEALGGGLKPGTLTAVVGATGIGKTHLAVSFAHAGKRQEGHTGIILDLTSRGDSQSHHEYAERTCDWKLQDANVTSLNELDNYYDSSRPLGDY